MDIKSGRERFGFWEEETFLISTALHPLMIPGKITQTKKDPFLNQIKRFLSFLLVEAGDILVMSRRNSKVFVWSLGKWQNATPSFQKAPHFQVCKPLTRFQVRKKTRNCTFCPLHCKVLVKWRWWRDSVKLLIIQFPVHVHFLYFPSTT